MNLTDDEIIDGFLLTGKASKAIPENFELPAETRKVLKIIMKSLEVITQNDTNALIALGMGFIEGYRHGRGDMTLADYLSSM